MRDGHTRDVASGRRTPAVQGVALLLALFVTGGSAGAAPVVLHAAFAWRGAPADKLDAFFKAFEADHPGIEIQAEPWYNSGIDQLAVRYVGGSAADLVWMSNELPLVAAGQGMLLDLSRYIERDNWGATIKDFHAPTIALMENGDHLYGLPMYTSIGTMFYNPNMAADAGIQIPDDWDWNTFATIARHLTVSDGGTTSIYGYQQIPAWLRIFPWLTDGGVDFSNPASVPLDTPEAVDTVRFWQDLVTQGVVSWSNSKAFRAQTSAMEISGSWELDAIRTSRVPIAFAPLPAGPKGRVTLANTDILSIVSSTKHPEEAWAFVKWFYQLDTQRRFLQLFGLQPARLSLGLQWTDAQKALVTAAGLPAWSGLDWFIRDTAVARPQPFFADNSVISGLIMPALNDIMTKHKPVQSTLSTMSQAAEAKLQSVGSGK